ncbi:MAG: DMT family transporter [Candidatus Marinimicrobia bacterium]|nr:DMT family transporter [Candidatus Neomarinimicrobiota bacterium]MBT3829120.1 DMT family transporter [Candidatus Neomarinimicrobiota bacterium]MBT3996705.1 DMT family transporter [Candidatus Neomarinimicrobiota bacterium]MBT4569071.1 DMT family transporter [Candidatus Neomarinimicrobiota bacterium]MBT4796461.1 DMT family transporter [Candidatus Neomarinimicrobiota bacterium]
MKTTKSLLYILMALAMITWGISWTNAKILGEYAHPYTLMFWRFLTGASALIPVILLLKEKLKCSAHVFKYVLLNGLFLATYNYFYFRGTQLGLAGSGGVLVTTLNPIFTVMITSIFLGAKLRIKDVTGLLLGIAGGVLIMRIWELDATELFASGNVHFVMGAFTWAFVTILASKVKNHIRILPFSFWSFLIAGILSFPLAVSQPDFYIFSHDSIFWMNFFLVSVGSMTFGTTVYFIAAMELGSEKASAFIFSVPAIAMLTAIIYLGEKITLTTAAGMLCGMTAVFLINRK